MKYVIASGTRARGKHSNINKQNEKVHRYSLQPGLCGDNLLTTHKGVIRGVFLADHLASTDNLTKTNNTQEHLKTVKHK